MPQLLHLLFATALIATAVAVGSAESVSDKGKPTLGAEAQGSAPSGVTVISSVQDPLLDVSASAVKTQRAAVGKSALIIRGGAVVRKAGNKYELTKKIEDIFVRGEGLSDGDVTERLMMFLGYPLSEATIIRRVKVLLRYRRDRAALHKHVMSFVDGLGEPSDSNGGDVSGGDSKGDGDDGDKVDDKDDEDKGDKDSGDNGDGKDDGDKGDDDDKGGDKGDGDDSDDDDGDDKDDKKGRLIGGEHEANDDDDDDDDGDDKDDKKDGDDSEDERQS